MAGESWKQHNRGRLGETKALVLGLGCHSLGVLSPRPELTALNILYWGHTRYKPLFSGVQDRTGNERADLADRVPVKYNPQLKLVEVSGEPEERVSGRGNVG